MRKMLSATPASKVALAIALGVLGVSLCYVLPALGAPMRQAILAPGSGPDEVWVDDDYDASTPGWGVTHFAAIQDGIDAVTETGTMHVLTGNYVENIVITKSLSLLGAGATTSTIDGQNSGYPIHILSANHVAVSGFTITGFDDAWNAGVRIEGGTFVTVTQNHFPSGGGVRMNLADNNTVSYNTFGGRGSIHLSGAWNNRIEGNELHVRYPGQIWVLGNSSNNVVISNTIIGDIEDPEGASCTGVRIAYSSNNLYANNTLQNFRVHILVVYSDDSIFANNSISGNRGDPRFAGGGIIMYHASNHQVLNNDIVGVSDVGISLFGSSISNTIRGNTISNTGRGIEVFYQSNHNLLVNNEVASNTIGIIVDGASHNTIYRNNFTENTTPGYDEGDNDWDHNGEGNYWSNYTGTDSNGDGIGDTPYTIPSAGSDHYPLMNSVSVTPAVVPDLEFVPLEHSPYYPAVIIDDHQVWENRTIELTNTIQVQDGGSLTLTNVTLVGGPWGIDLLHVHSGGTLQIYNSTLIGHGGSILAGEGGNLRIENSELYGLGSWDADGTIGLSGGGAVIQNNIIRDGYAGIEIGSSHNQIIGNQISNMRYGIGTCCEDYTGNVIQDNEISNMICGGIGANKFTESTITGNEIRNVWGHPINLYYWHEEAQTFVYENSIIDSGLPHGEDACQWDYGNRGNFWSDYQDRYPGAQEHPTYPGIWDTPYAISGGISADQYPLMYSVPAVWATDVTEVSPVSATLEAHFLKKEYDTVYIYFEYRKAGSAHWQSSSPIGYTSSGIHTTTITALEPVTEYEYRPILTYDRGQVTGDVHTFNTRDTIANFTAAPVQGVAPLTVTFAAAAEPPATYLWDFGDQVTSTLQGPVHTYTAVGFYTVTLTVSTTVQSATLSRVEYISVWEDQIHLPLVLRNH